jgi:hypothetical protein
MKASSTDLNGSFIDQVPTSIQMCITAMLAARHHSQPCTQLQIFASAAQATVTNLMYVRSKKMHNRNPVVGIPCPTEESPNMQVHITTGRSKQATTAFL